MADPGFLHRRTKDYGKLPAALMHDLSITDGAARLYGHMHWRYGQNHTNFEGETSMAQLLGVTEKTIGNRIKELEAKDWVVTINRGVTEKGHYQTPYYHVFEYQDDCRLFRETYKPVTGEKIEPKPEAREKVSRSGKGNPTPVNPYQPNSGSHSHTNSSSDGDYANHAKPSSDGHENSSSDGVASSHENSSSDYPVTPYPATEVIQKDNTTLSLSNALKSLAPAHEERVIDFETGEILDSSDSQVITPPPKPLVAPQTSEAEAWALTHNQLMLIYKHEDIRAYVDNLLWVGVEDGVGVISVPTQVGKELCEIKVMRNIENNMTGLGVKIARYCLRVIGETAKPAEHAPIHPDAAINGAAKKPINTVELMRQAREIADNNPKVRNKEAYVTRVYQDLLKKAGAA